MPAAANWEHRGSGQPMTITPELASRIQAFLEAQEKEDAMNGGDRSRTIVPANRTQQQPSKQLHEQLAQHAHGLRSALGRLAPFGVQMLVSGVAYSTGLCFAQILGTVVRVSCVTPVLSSCLGAVGVAGASVLSGHMTRHSRRQMAAGKNPVQAVVTPFWQDFNMDEAVLDVLSGLLLFKFAGGSFRRLMPSDLRSPGAFGFTSVPIGSSKYASDGEKGQLEALFRRDGCHHCGTKRGPVIGDHIPPNKMVADALKAPPDATQVINTLKSLLTPGGTGVGAQIRQAYYAQCQRCSKVQSALMRHGRRSALVFHRLTVPPGLTPGFLVGFRNLCDPGGSQVDPGAPNSARKSSKGGARAVESQPGIWTWVTRMDDQPPGQDVFRSFEERGLASSPAATQAGSRDGTLALIR